MNAAAGESYSQTLGQGETAKTAVDGNDPGGGTAPFAGQQSVLQGIALVALAVGPFLPTLRGPFFWDDATNIVNNGLLRSPAGLRAIWTDPLASAEGTYQYYPATYTLFWIEFHLFGERPASYHAVNLLLHAINALLLWRAVGAFRAATAWWAAALFAVHPIQMDTVGWITEQKNLLSTLFALLAVIAWDRWARRGGAAFLVAATVAFIASLASKTAVVALPVWLLLAETMLRRSPPGRWASPLLLWVALSAGAGAITAWREGGASLQTGLPTDTPPMLRFDERLLLACQNLWRYVATIACLEPFVPIPVRSTPAWQNPSAVATLIGVVVVATAAIWRARRGRPGLVLGLSFFALLLGPTLGFVSFQFQVHSFVADHFAYFACAGLVAVIAEALLRDASSRRRIAGGALLLALAILTWRQSALFADPERLWTETARVNPAAWLPPVALSELQLRRGAFAEAAASSRNAIAAEPLSSVAHNNLGYALNALGRAVDAEAPLREAVRLAPGESRYRFNLALVLFKQQHWREAVEEWRRVTKAIPDSAMAHAMMGVACRHLGDKAQARTSLTRALQIDPTLNVARRGLAELDAESRGQ